MFVKKKKRMELKGRYGHVDENPLANHFG